MNLDSSLKQTFVPL